MRHNNRAFSAAMWGRIILTAAICTLGLAQRSEANAAYYSDAWMGNYYDDATDSVPTYGMGVVEASYGEYYDVSTTSYQYGPNDDWTGCLDEDEYYAEADTVLLDVYYIDYVDDTPFTYLVISDHSADSDNGPVDLGSSDAEMGAGKFITHYDYDSGDGAGTFTYNVSWDSSGKACSAGKITGSEAHIDGATNYGYYAIENYTPSFTGCLGPCAAGHVGTVKGENGNRLMADTGCIYWKNMPPGF